MSEKPEASRGGPPGRAGSIVELDHGIGRGFFLAELAFRPASRVNA